MAIKGTPAGGERGHGDVAHGGIRGTMPSDPPAGYTKSGVYDNAQSPQLNGNDSPKQGNKGRSFNMKAVARILEESGINPMKAIVEVLKSDKIDPKTRAMIELELLQYQAPKLKAVEVTQKNELTDEEVLSRLRYLESKAKANGAKPGEPDSEREGGAT